eukprot:2727774-Prymnesium_polylepis.1
MRPRGRAHGAVREAPCPPPDFHVAVSLVSRVQSHRAARSVLRFQPTTKAWPLEASEAMPLVNTQCRGRDAAVRDVPQPRVRWVRSEDK